MIPPLTIFITISSLLFGISALEFRALGLSLSYDIIKAHGGEIKVNTIEGEFTEFVIQLPISV
jgi:signal transduction histidine kinase